MKLLLFAIAMLWSSLSMINTTDTPPDRVITGKVIDAATNEPLIYANVVACGNIGVVTDLDGLFTLTMPDSCPHIEIFYTGYSVTRITLDQKHHYTIAMETGATLNEIVVTELRRSLIKQDHTTQGNIKTAEQIRNLPVKNINDIARTTAGLSSKDGRDANIRGSRSNATGYYLDGIKVSRNSAQNNQPPSTVPIPEPELTMSTEDYDFIEENQFQRPEDAPLSTFSIDVDVASYANMRRYLNMGLEPPRDAIRIEELVNYFDYQYPQPSKEHPITFVTEVASCPWALANRLVHVGLQGKTIPTADLPPSNLVFLVDVSGSMADPNKLPLVIESFKVLTGQLRTQDRVAIVVYAGAAGLVLPSTAGSDKTRIIDALTRLQAGGSTAGAQGIKLAYEEAQKNFIKGGNNRVILATDGDFNVGVSSDSELITLIEKERESGVFLTTLGYGMGNYKDNKLEKLADHGNGNHGYVDNIEEAEKVFVHEFGGTLFTIAKDVKIQVEFNPQHVAGYRLIGYENRMLAAEDFNDDKKDAGEMGSGHSVTALYEIIPMDTTSTFLKSVDDLKYQKSKVRGSNAFDDELMTIKFRYKDPDGTESKLLEHVVSNTNGSFMQASENYRWSASVASFGLILRDSEFMGTATLEEVEVWALDAKGNDEHGYRAEFIKLIRSTKKLGLARLDEQTVERK